VEDSGDVNGAARWVVGTVLPLAMTTLACEREPRPPLGPSAVADRALQLLPSPATGRALFPGETLAVLREAPRDRDARALRELRAEVAAAAAGSFTVQARWHVARGDYDAALRTLAQVGDLESNDPSLRQERAAILIERHRAVGRALDAAAALDALAFAGDEPVARYDRAIALCALGLPVLAQRELVAIGLDERVRTRAGSFGDCAPPVGTASPDLDLARAIVLAEEGDSRPLRAAIEEHELPRWLEEGASAGAALAEAVAELERASGDGLPARLLRALGPPSPPRLLTAARAWSAAERHSREMRPEAALAMAETAARELGDGSPAWGARIELTAIASRFHLQRYEETIAGARRLRATAARECWHDLQARCLWLEGMSELQSGRPALALPLLAAASERFIEAREPGLSAALRVLESDAFGALGDLERSLALRIGASRELRHYGLTARVVMALDNATFPLLRAGLPHAALSFVDEAIAEAGSGADPLGDAERRWRRSTALLATGRSSEALEAAEEALTVAARIESEAFRDRTRAGIEAARGAALVEIAPERAARDLEAAIRLGERTGFEWFLPDLLVSRARALRRLGEVSATRDALGLAFAAAERWTRGAAGGFDRALYLDTRRRIIEEAIDLHLRELADAAGALDWALRARELATGRASAELAAADCRGDQPSLALVALPDRLVRFTCASGEVVASEIAVGRPELEARIGDLRRQISAEVEIDDWLADSGTLFSWLLAPVAAPLRDGQTVRIVADGPLAGLPFPALRDAATGRYVAELGAVLLAETWSGGDPRAPAASAGAALIVANPRLDDETAAGFPSLAAAEREARRIAERRAGSRILMREDATREAVERALPGAAIVHLAAHGVANPADPGRAALLLAGVGPQAQWRAADIASRKLPALRLVVLSACESGRGYETATVGSLSLARAFLAAGAEAVVGTQWAIDDALGERFVAHFYDEIARGHAVGAALTRAQRAFIQSADPRERSPASWAGYFVVAGTPVAEGEEGS
jgi:CHAT domain-containing protein